MWIYRPEDDNYFSQLAKCSDGDDVGECVIYFDPDDVPPSPAQGAMFAESLNAHEQTGLTPAQLQARVAELEAAVFDLHFTACNDDDHDINSKTASALLALYHKVRRNA